MSDTLTIHNTAHEPIYQIVFQKEYHALAQHIRELGLEGRKVCIVTDSNTYRLYDQAVRRVLEPLSTKVVSYTFPAGETHKTLDTVRDLYRLLIEEKFDRKDYLAALGGGVTGDVTGFAAATYLRGISFIQLPTTLLAQSDSSVGGKTGVDFNGYKNMVGAFCMPRLVYMNVSTLKTMNKREYLSGMGEVVKHGLIRDRRFLEWLTDHHDAICGCEEEALMTMDYHNCSIKGAVVEEDPTEQGIRSLLNFGHTLGHAIEKQKAGELFHGECVSVGMAAAAYISWLKGYLSREELELVTDALKAFDLPVKVSGINLQEAVLATRNDKKVQGNTIRFILLKHIGEAVIDTSVTTDEMYQALSFVAE